MTSKLSSPQPAGIDFQMGVARSVSSWMKMTKMNMEGGKSGPESDYARAEREQTKLQLHNITKRLCEVNKSDYFLIKLLLAIAGYRKL